MIQRRVLKLYTPHAEQLRFHKSKARYRVAAYGRQSGKSTACINELLKHAWEKPGTRYWYISPTFQQALQQYRRAVGMLMACQEVLLKKNQTELRIKLINQSEIVFKSGEVLDNLRGETLHGAITDEVRDQPPELWPMVIRPMLATTKGWAAFVSTPNGLDAFHDLYQRALSDPNWESFRAPSTCNPLFTQEEFESAKAEMNEDQFAQEIMAEFRDFGSGTCYVTFSEKNVLGASPFAINGQLISPYLPIIVGMDFNLNPMSWILGQHRTRDIYWHDEISLTRTHTEEAAKVLADRVKGHKPGVIIIGDASGKAGQRAATAGQSDYDVVKSVLKSNDINFEDRTPDSNPGIKDRVNTVNALFRSANGESHMWYSPRCKTAIKDRQRRKWKDGASTLAFDNSDPMAGHMSDAADYAAVVLCPLKGVTGVGKLHVISRSF